MNKQLHCAWIIIATFVALVVVSCEKKSDTIDQAEQTDKKAGVPAPGIEETRAIAEEGFIYGLPIVMNYAVMYADSIDRSSGQFKAPFNQIVNEHRVYTYKDTVIIAANSDTPYSGAFLDLRAEPIVLSLPDVDLKRYYVVQLTDASTYNYGYMGSRATGGKAGDYMVVGPEWKGSTPAGIKQVFRSGSQFSLIAFRTQLFGANDMDNVIKVQDRYKVQTLSSYLKQPPPPPAPVIDFPKIDKELIKENFFDIWISHCNSFPPKPTKRRYAPNWPASASGPAKHLISRTFRWSTKLKSRWV
jgi:hypothetical protein